MTNQCLGRILVVEDEAKLRFILATHLRSAGFEVLEATDGCAAMEIATEHLPELIIMDVGLPGMDGVAATRALKSDRRTADVPVIMLTGRSKTEDVVRGLEAGAQEYVSKPFDVMELLARVQTVYRLARARKDLDQLNTRLEAEVDVKTKRLQLLYEFMRDLNQADSRDEILDLVVRCAEQLTAARRISLLLREGTSDSLVCARAVGIDPSIVQQIRVNVVEGIAGQVLQSGKTLAAKAYGANFTGDREYRRGTFLSTPLVTTSLETKEGVIGVLNITERTDDGPFCEEEVDCIRSIADAAAIALDALARRSRLENSVRILLQTVGHLAEFRDEETTLHLERVTRMARILATEVGRAGPYAAQVTDQFIESIVQAAPMHDIGKVGIPDEILTKPGRLTHEEFQIMKTHTDIGRRVLSRALDPARPVPLLQMCIDIAHGHHERWDGQGYPRRVAGRDIPLAARIIALVDAYDAITSRRRYKTAKSHEEAVDVIQSDAGTHFDPGLVDAFLRCHKQFSKVRAEYEEHEDPVGVAAGALR